jgi:hypothetical protein
MTFSLPDPKWGENWELCVDTADPEGVLSAPRPVTGSFELTARSLAVLRHRT